MADYRSHVRSIAERQLDLAVKADRHKDQKILQRIRAIAISGNAKAAAALERQLIIAAATRLVAGKKFPTPSITELMAHAHPSQSLILGRVAEAGMTVFYAVALTRQHILVLGATGEGKTSLLLGLVIQFVRFGSVWVLEGGMKTDFRHLTQIIDDLLVFNPDTLAFNPLEPFGGTNPGTVLRAFEENFTMSNWLREGSQSMLGAVSQELFRERRVYEGNRDDLPTLIDVRHRIAGSKVPGYSRSAGYKDSLLNRLDAAIREAPNLYTYRNGFSIGELANRSFVYELQNLSPRHGAFQVYSLLSALLHYRIAEGQRSDLARPLLVVVDEAKWIAPDRNELGFSPLEFLLAQSRELGVSFVFSDQTTELNPSLFTQCRLIMAFRMGGGTNIDAVRRAFALSRDQVDAVHHLDVGQAVVRMPRVDPFVLETPRFPID